MSAPCKKSYDKRRHHIKKQRHHFADKGAHSQSYGFFSSHVWMWELDHEEGRALKNWSFQAVVLQKTLEGSLDCKEIKPVHPKGSQPWIFTGRTDAETPILWPPHAKSWLIGKDSDAGRDWGQEEKGTTEDEIAGWHHWLDGMSLSELWELVLDREAWRAAIHGVTKSRTRLSNWTELNWLGKWQNSVFLSAPNGNIFDIWSQLSFTFCVL